MITLPNQPRRAWLMSFGLAMSALGGLLFGVFLWIFTSPYWFVVGLMLSLGIALLGMLRPKAILMPYKVWNKLTFYYVRGARLLLKFICFHIVLVPLAQTGSSLNVSRPAPTKSLWIPRKPHTVSSYLVQHDGTTSAFPQRGWIRSYLSWAKQSSHLWAICLLPFLILLKIVEDEERSTFPTNIYTLF